MPDRYVGRRTPEGGWTWEAEGSSKPDAHHHILLIALVAAAGAITACLLGAGVLLARNDNSPGPSISPPTGASKFSFMMWNPNTGQWQTENLNLAAHPEHTATFLLNLSGSGLGSHDVTVSFECGDSGSVELVEPHEALPALTEPGPGRARPDTTALNGALAAWGATFTRTPVWDGGAPCAELQTLEFGAVSRGDAVSFMWKTASAGGPATDAVSLSVAASVDGEPPQTLNISY